MFGFKERIQIVKLADVKSCTLLLLYFVFVHASIYSQSKLTENLKLSGAVHAGYSMPEYSFISYQTDDYIRSFELSLLKETYGKKPWEVLYNFPEYGVSFFYSTLGNDAVFGRAFALNYFFKLKIIQSKRFELYNRIGIGLGYLTKKFAVNNNYMNLAIGSHVNVHFVFKLGGQLRLTDKISTNLGLSFDHFSNANTHDPNRGLNLFTGEAGLTYLIGNKKDWQFPKFEEHQKTNNLTLFAAMGVKQPRSFENVRYGTASIALSVNREVRRAFHLGAGIDIFYDSYAKVFLEKSGNDYHAYNSFQTGINISQQFVYNKFRIIIQEGIYVGLVNKVIPKSFYNRAIVQYAVTENMHFRIAMKSHLHILDYPEFGIGVKF